MEITLEDPRVGDLHNYTDELGITHVFVLDADQAFELIDGEWVEKAPF